MTADSREPLVEVALQVLCVCLENDIDFGRGDKREESDAEETVTFGIGVCETIELVDIAVTVYCRRGP